MFYTCNTPKTSEMYYRCGITGYVVFNIIKYPDLYIKHFKYCMSFKVY